MKPGDIVRVRPSSVCHQVVGDAEGEARAVAEHTRLAWVRFQALGLTAEGWRWEELVIVAEREEAELR